MDTDLQFYTKLVEDFKIMIPKLENTNALKDKQLKQKDVQIDILEKDRQRLFEKWKEDNRLRHECEEKSKWGSWIAWGTAGVATVVAIVLGVYLGGM